MALTSHHAANFVVQAALAGAEGKQQVRAGGAWGVCWLFGGLVGGRGAGA